MHHNNCSFRAPKPDTEKRWLGKDFKEEQKKAQAFVDSLPNDKAAHKERCTCVRHISDTSTEHVAVDCPFRSPTPHEKWEEEFSELLMDFLVQQLAWGKSKNEDIYLLVGSPVLQEMAEKKYDKLKSFIRDLLQREREAAFEAGKRTWEDALLTEKDAFKEGAAQEQKRILEIVEGMRNDLEKKIRSENVGELTTKNEPHNSWITGRFQALTDLRAKLEDDLEK